MLHLYEMCPCLKVEVKVEVEGHQELEIKHLNRGTKIENNMKFLHSSNASIMSMQPKKIWLILECTWCLQCNDGTVEGIVEGHSCQDAKKQENVQKQMEWIEFRL